MKEKLRNAGTWERKSPQECAPISAVITPFGLFEFLLKNVGMTFQRFRDQVFNGLGFILIYINNILVASKEYINQLREVLSRVGTGGLVLNLPKCTFSHSSVDFLGHHVSPQGIHPVAANVEALYSHPWLNTVKGPAVPRAP